MTAGWGNVSGTLPCNVLRSVVNTNTLRHVLLAEPLVDDVARCFQCVGSEAARLADSFRFDACLKRERLIDILRSAATA
jgi:hypothetical protein